ncbi:MAG: bifunctional hydroxymethylpyrimidine kinase/phosphomethylpyrimidine kinase [Candidatus Altiarchaeales archaeon]|nr:MAG: bifunctional hydroxymethylpyrimidine kinase/phosphomethylpyrimidine kinase [Candidatus Altiarchaeales archaeon]HDO82816.1 bifunctional hydroxymethylpyrimidine kinase/phosphomethylpyrimidine kinase [Candidatus Altiarchaeales archaeon]HEX55465.1 bifunctional hydroxymethylpyrimidine kinase/phosphomethylpyrimidine kinase [Candidatus Altiarchaeales archaeon]
MRIKSVVTIGGSDSCGGAGIQQDLKVFSQFGVHGASVLTAVTAQNTLGVQDILILPEGIIEEQIDSIFNDLKPIAVKTGMLPTREIIKLVCDKILEYGVEKLVVDPVMTSTSGNKLMDENAINSLHNLISISTLCTPNIREAEVLSGMEIKKLEDMESAARKIGNCVVKGGHLNLTDVLHYNGNIYRFKSSEDWRGEFHGTGCAFASAITACLANEHKIFDSVRIAKDFIDSSISRNIAIGKGLRIIDTSKIKLGRSYREEERAAIVEDVETAILKFIDNENSHLLLPQVGTNIAMALRNAKKIDDVAGISGRLVRDKNRVVAVGTIEFGGSSHIGRVVLTAMRFDPEKRAAMNIRFSDEILNACRELRLKISNFNREEEPKDTKTMEWGISHAIKKAGSVPDIIYDEGGVGKEAMVRIIANNAVDVVNLAIMISNLLN